MQLSSAAFGGLTQRLRTVAEKCCAGRLVLTLEGGYDLRALGESVAASVGALIAEGAAAPTFPVPAPHWETVVEGLRTAHADSWPVLRESARA
jgi:acetoin utilization deacetylase AcuC-like enzyme